MAFCKGFVRSCSSACLLASSRPKILDDVLPGSTVSSDVRGGGGATPQAGPDSAVGAGVVGAEDLSHAGA